MWKFPGAISTVPWVTESLFFASFTVIGHRPLRRSAKAVVKFAGMCCTTTVPDEFAGIRVSTALRASVPPVEAPIAMTWLVVRARARTGSGEPPFPGPSPPCFTIRAREAARIFSASWALMSPTV